MEGVRERRLKELSEALEHARRVAECIREKIPSSAVVLVGSYARGDFNKWSDIDLLVVSGSQLPENPLKRLELIHDCLAQGAPVEPVVVTLEELRGRLLKKDPLALEASTHGIIIHDAIGVREALRKRI